MLPCPRCFFLEQWALSWLFAHGGRLPLRFYPNNLNPEYLARSHRVALHVDHRIPLAMIKYLGSKRRLVPILGELLVRSGAETALDLFTGTTRVAQEFKRRGAYVTAVDIASYSEVFAQCHISIDADKVRKDELVQALEYLNHLPGTPGYFTEVFCVRSRFFQPHNGERIDAIRDCIEKEFKDSALYPILLTSLVYAADKVDSTTGVQMAYVKRWAPRSYGSLELRVPELYPGTGRAIRADAYSIAKDLPKVDLAYLDPPYNQHRYYTNYHIWETLIRWDAPEFYGVACKRADSKSPVTKSVFNMARKMPQALRQVIADVQSEVIILSYNNESWVSLEDLVEMCSIRGETIVLSFEQRRYVGAQIGVYDPNGRKVGQVSHLHNVEYLIIAGPKGIVSSMTRSLARNLVRL